MPSQGCMWCNPNALRDQVAVQARTSFEENDSANERCSSVCFVDTEIKCMEIGGHAVHTSNNLCNIWSVVSKIYKEMLFLREAEFALYLVENVRR